MGGAADPAVFPDKLQGSLHVLFDFFFIIEAAGECGREFSGADSQDMVGVMIKRLILRIPVERMEFLAGDKKHPVVAKILDTALPRTGTDIFYAQ